MLRLLPILLALAACSGGSATPTNARVEGSGLLIETPGYAIAHTTLSVDGREASLSASFSWHLRRADLVELRGLPPDLKTVRAGGHLVVDRSLPGAPFPEPAPGRPGCCLALFAMGAIYAMVFVGITGGPNNGEHPFIITFIHLGAFLIFAGGWNWAAWGLYAALLAGALAASVLAIPVRSDNPRMQWGLRAVLLLLHLPMGWMLWNGPEMAPLARWRTPQAIELHVPPSQRHAVKLLDAAGRELAGEPMSAGVEVRTLWFWTSTEAPATVRIVRPDGTTRDLALGSRP